MALSWWEQQNQNAIDFNNRNAGVQYMHGGSPAPQSLISAPIDFSNFRQNFGGGYATEGDYKNWSIGQQRERTMGDFVNRMSTQDPNATANASRLQGQATDFGNRMTGYLDTAAPVASNTNRFETGLTDAETRLRNLLDNPDSINQSAAYKFRVGQGEEALQRSMGAKGMLNSGNRLMELTKYGQDMGSQEYDAQFSRLSDLMKTGTTGYIGDRGASNQAQDIANRFSLGSEANLQNRQRMQAGQTTPSNGISNPWALPGYNGYNY